MSVNDYGVDIFDPENEEETSERFQASSDDEAVAFALKEFGTLVDSIYRIEDAVHVLVWEAHPNIYLKYIAEGATNIDDVIGSLQGVISELEQLKATGAVLEAVDGGHVILNRPASHFEVSD